MASIELTTVTTSTSYLSNDESSRVIPEHSSSEQDGDENDFSDYDYDYDYGSGYRDDLDIRLTPPAPHKPSRARRNKQNKKSVARAKPAPPFTKIIQPIVDCSRPLLFPLEVLELVCLHLTQATLRHCVSLVCKSWNTVSDRYIRRIGVWTSASDIYEERLLQQMSRLDTLECWFGIDPDVPESESALIYRTKMELAWARFRDAIVMPLQDPPQDNKDDSSNRTCLLHYIQHLTLRGDYMNYADPLPTIQNEFRFLRTLTILSMTHHIDVYLIPILDCSPELRELTIKSKSYDYNHSMFIYFEDENEDEDDDAIEPPEPILDPETAHFPVKPKVGLPSNDDPRQYGLQVFECSGVFIKQRVLERVISVCPELRVLKALEINSPTWHLFEEELRPLDIDETGLLKLAKISCPNLEWMSAQKAHRWVDEIYMDRQNLYFPESRFLTLTSTVGEFEMPIIPAVATFLQHITVLEIKTMVSNAFDSSIFNKILCRMPHLLHLHAFGGRFHVRDLYQPPKPVVTAPKPFIENIRERRRAERLERQRQRREALLRFQNLTSDDDDDGDDDDDDDDDDVSSTSLSAPRIWQCRDLRTLEISLYPLGDIQCVNRTWAEYVDRNRLFRNLTSLRLHGSSLHLGQLQEIPHITRQRAKVLEELNARRSKRGLALIQAEFDVQRPKRFGHDLLPLRGLRSLEVFRLYVENIPGMLHPKDFDFLQQRSVETIIRIISHEDDHDTARVGGPRQSEPGIADDHSHRQEEETFWPRLLAFHIRYTSHLQEMTDFTGVVAGMRSIRPAVEFSIKEQYHSIVIS
ncbi:hypothetical protein BGZ98_003635 [Dissophora globulifera]|nr:hypothetical protein BGZ98_003635 [Dissophora globulifera]